MRNPNVMLLTLLLPTDLIRVIDSFCEYPKKKKNVQISPSTQKELKRIQTIYIRNKPTMYMKGLEDFCLD